MPSGKQAKETVAFFTTKYCKYTVFLREFTSQKQVSRNTAFCNSAHLNTGLNNLFLVYFLAYSLIT